MPKTRYPLEAGNIAPRIVAWLVEGRTHEDIAFELTTRRAPVTRQAVTSFAKRHAAEIEALRAQIAERVQDVTIADVEERVRQWARMNASLWAIHDDRVDNLGYPSGFLAKERKMIGSGLDQYEVDVWHTDRALVESIARSLDGVAEHKGQLPKRGVYIDNRKQTQTITLEALEALLGGT